MPHTVEAALTACWPPPSWRDVSVVVAVSGGADSVALLRGLVAVKGGGSGRLVVAHFHHGLRAADADADERFVRDLAARLDLPFFGGKATALAEAKESGDSLESIARRMRYEFLRDAAEEHGARYVATAHTADDQAETILHHVLRGTGLGGLSGIPRLRCLGDAVTVIRPLLTVRRADVLDYLRTLDQPYRRDASNDDPRFTRNRIRHELLPIIERDYNAQAVEALLRLGSLAGEAQQVIERLVGSLAERAVQDDGQGPVCIACGQLTAEPRYLVRELFVAIWRWRGWPLRSMGYDQWEQLAEQAKCPADMRPQVRTYPGGIRVCREGDRLLIEAPAGA